MIIVLTHNILSYLVDHKMLPYQRKYIPDEQMKYEWKTL